MPRSPGRAGRPWRRLQAQVYAEETHCWRCGQPVDMTRKGQRHRLAPSTDHLVPISKGGDPLDRGNVRLAHLGCNAAAGNRLTPKRSPRTRDW